MTDRQKILPYYHHTDPMKRITPVPPIDLTLGEQSAAVMNQPVALLTDDALRLNLHVWRRHGADVIEVASPAPQMVVVIAHGLGGHAGYYHDSLAPYLAAAGAAVYAPDLRGHGLSDGLRGDIANFDHFQRDIAAAVRHARTAHPDLPLFLLGESMGTPLVITYCATGAPDAQPDGLILAACVVAPTVTPHPDEVARTLWYATTNRRRPALPITGREEQGVRDPLFVQVLKSDPMFNKKVSVRFLSGMALAMRRAGKMGGRLRLPTLVMQGGKDITIRWRATHAFYRSIAAADTEIHIFPDAYHAILNDPDSPRVRAVLLAWLARQTAAFESLGAVADVRG